MRGLFLVDIGLALPRSGCRARAPTRPHAHTVERLDYLHCALQGDPILGCHITDQLCAEAKWIDG